VPALEITAPSAVEGVFVAGGVAQEAPLPAEAGPLAQDGAVDLVGAGGGRPVYHPPLERVVAPTGGGTLVARGEAHHASLRAQAEPLAQDGAVDLVGAGGGRPVDHAILE